MTVRLGLIGAGLIGARHAAAIAQARGARLAAIVDPSPEALDQIDDPSALRFSDPEALIAAKAVDGLIIATPNRLHAAQTGLAIEAGLPALVEKPFTDTVAEGEALVAAARAKGVPLLTGHHRRYNPLIEKGRALIESGAVGQVLTIQTSCWLKKPDAYFEAPWRRQKGAGPVLVNLIHDVDLMRYLCGDVASVQAMTANLARGHEIEDSAVCILRFASGALATMTLSDAVPAPLSWELTAAENPAYAPTGESCYWIGGSEGTLALPQLTLWRHPDGGDWWSPIDARRYPVPATDPLVTQVEHFADVIRGKAQPRVSGADGLEATRIIDAIHRSAETGTAIALTPPQDASTSPPSGS